MKRCLLIDSDAGDRERLSQYLMGFDLDVTAAGTAAALRHHLSNHAFDVVLMDLSLPDDNGLAMCQWVQDAHRLPLIAMNRGGDIATRVAGLEHGADDVIDRPCDLRELVAHVRALLRRTAVRSMPAAGPVASPASPLNHAAQWRIAGWLLQPDTGTLRAPDGSEQQLKPSESKLLLALAQPPKEVMRREWLAAQLPTAQHADALRQVDLTVASLRHKLQDPPPHCTLILTVRGAGYVLHADVQSQ